MNYLSKKDKYEIVRQWNNCITIPYMVPLIKIHKNPIKWRPVCRIVRPDGR